MTGVQTCALPIFAVLAVLAAGLSKSNFVVSLGAVAVPLLATVMVMVQVLYVQQHGVGADQASGSRSAGFDPDLDEALEGATAA